MDLRQLKTAGTQEGGRRPFQKLDIQFGMDLCGEIHILFVHKALDPVKHSVYFVKSTLDGVFIYPCKA